MRATIDVIAFLVLHHPMSQENWRLQPQTKKTPAWLIRMLHVVCDKAVQWHRAVVLTTVPRSPYFPIILNDPGKLAIPP